MARVARTQPEWALIPPTAPATLVQMLRGCLEKDPSRRFQRLTDVLGPIRTEIGEEGAVEAFLRQSALGRMSRGRVEPHWTDEGWLKKLRKFVPSLKRSAQGRLPRGLEDDTADIVEDQLRTVRYGEALQQLGERDRSLIESRLEDHATYEEIATRFSLPTADAARMSVTRAMRRLADRLAKITSD